jgi:hypothetical protein
VRNFSAEASQKKISREIFSRGVEFFFSLMAAAFRGVPMAFREVKISECRELGK